MPYAVRKEGGKWVVKNTTTGDTSTPVSEKKAKRIKVIQAARSGHRPGTDN